MKLLKQTIIASAIALATSNVASAATLDINANGVLMGAFGVDVNGSLYDVTFGDGVFGDSITAITTVADAQAASQALLDQVLLGDYDTLAKNTNGCTYRGECLVTTPYRKTLTSLSYVLALNLDGTKDDTVSSAGYFFGVKGNTMLSNMTIAKWTASTAPSATAVPEPEAYAMMLAGLGLVGFAARRKLAK